MPRPSSSISTTNAACRSRTAWATPSTCRGSVLVLVTNRCACEMRELRCLTREMEGDEYRMVCDVFDKAVKEAEQAVETKTDPKPVVPMTPSGELLGDFFGDMLQF